jgi:hypothetical protein
VPFLKSGRFEGRSAVTVSVILPDRTQTDWNRFRRLISKRSIRVA